MPAPLVRELLLILRLAEFPIMSYAYKLASAKVCDHSLNQYTRNTSGVELIRWKAAFVD